MQANRDYLQKQYEELQKEFSKIKAHNENLDRNLHSKTELLLSVEKQQKEFYQKTNKEIAQMKKETYTKLHEKQVEYEDLRSFAMERHDFVL